MAKNIFWFRRDLRLADNAGLAAAAKAGEVLPVFVFAKTPAAKTASDVWFFENLRALAADITKAGGRLLLLRGNAAVALPALAAATGAAAVFCNSSRAPAEEEEERRLAAALPALPLRVFSDNLLRETRDIKTQSGNAYRVFTPFYRGAYLPAALPPPTPAPRLRWAQAPAKPPPALAAAALPAAASLPAWAKKVLRHWQAGESAANKRTREFAAQAEDYGKRRDLPAEGGVSRLSPYLACGALSAPQAAAAVGGDAAHPFFRQLVWRDFSYYLLRNFPALPRENWRQEFNRFPWRQSKADLQKWQSGKTGIPIVDAGMRELWQTGYMHNRVRMLVASFLCKNLLLPWQCGAAWFMRCLVDADEANNSAGWQWTAGSGADAAPYFRVFNPVLQGKKFDAQGDYVRRFLPALRHLPAATIHEPWLAGGRKGLPAANGGFGKNATTRPCRLCDNEKEKVKTAACPPCGRACGAIL